MTLREATIKILQDNHETIMSAESIASIINKEGLFHRPIDSRYLLLGIMNYPKYFQVLIELRKQRRRLTPREAEVVAYRCSGFTTAEVGEILGISPHTVRRESDHAFNKLGVANLTRALRECLRQRYFTVNELPL